MTVNKTAQSEVAKRLADVQLAIEAAAARSGREASCVTIVAVTKGIGPELIRAGLAAGLRHLGENRIQEWLPKAEELGPGPRWHMIGQLQTNKVRYLARGIRVLHSLDRPVLHEALARRWELWRAGIASSGGQDSSGAGVSGPECLVQVNVAGEATKAGIEPCELDAFLAQIAARGVLCIRGLMTVAPYTGRPEEVRWVFAALRELRDRAQERFPEMDLGQLSMGMSGDYQVAVEEGATIVRIGTAIFGARG